MKRHLLFILPLWACLIGTAQTLENVQQIENGFSYHDTHDGGFYETNSYTQPFLLDPADPNSLMTPDPRLTVVRHYDENGEVDWSGVNYNWNTSSRQIYARSITAKDNGFIINYSGYMLFGNAANISFNPNESVFITSIDKLVVQYDSEGSVVAMQTLTDNVSIGHTLDMPDGSTAITYITPPSQFIDFDGDGQNDQTPYVNGVTSSVFVVRYDEDFNHISTASWDRMNSPLPTYLSQQHYAIRSDGSILLATLTNTSLTAPNDVSAVVNRATQTTVLIDISADGEVRSMDTFDGTGDLRVSALLVSDEGEIIMSGSVSDVGSVQLDQGSTESDTELTDCTFIAKLNADLGVIDLRSSTGMNDMYFNYMALDDSGTLHAVCQGKQQMHMDFDTSPEANPAFIHGSVFSNSSNRIMYAQYDGSLRAQLVRSIGTGTRHLNIRHFDLIEDGSMYMKFNAGVPGTHDVDMGSGEHLVTMPTQTQYMAKYAPCESTMSLEQMNVCEGESVTLNNGETLNNLMSDQLIERREISISGCDDIVNYAITVHSPQSRDEEMMICPGSDFTYPDGTVAEGINTSTTHTSAMSSVFGCDSTIITSLIVLAEEATEESVTLCPGESYQFPDGSIATEIVANMSQLSTITGTNGCAATVTTEVVVRETETSEETVSLCEGESYTFPDGETAQNIEEAMIHVSSVTGSNGCEAFVTTTIEVRETESTIEFVSVCAGEEYTFPDGTNVVGLNQAFSHVSVIDAINGCDSTITTNLSIYASEDSEESLTLCAGESYTFPDGNTVTDITEAITYVSEMQTDQGCAMEITTTIDLFDSQDSEETVTLCRGESYTFPDGVSMDEITEGLTYVSNLQTSEGCDMEIWTIIEVSEMEIALTETAAGLETDLVSDDYQWFVCGDELSPIDGATSATFMPTANGAYALSLTIDGCTFTSECVSYALSSIEENELSRSIDCYPNPATDRVVIDLSRLDDRSGLTLRLLDLSGRQVISRVINESDGQMIELPLDVTSGSYLLTFSTGALSTTERLIVK